MYIEYIADYLPYFIKRPLRYIYGSIPPRIRYGRVFWETYNLLQESQWWSKEKLEDYQMQQLGKLLEHAYRNVPYYRKVFEERGLKPKDIQDISDLRKLPYLTKDIIREKLKELVALNFPRSRLRYATTGGTTGIPLRFCNERGVSDAKEWAFIVIQWERVGFKIGDRRVVLMGDVVKSADKGRLWEYDPINECLILSSYHMTEDTLPQYVERIREFKPDFIHAYPSVVSIIARYIKENKIECLPKVKAILCCSENLYPWQRILLEDAFQTRIFSFYGHTEQAVLAGECEKSSFYHIFPEYGIFELIGKDGERVIEEDKIGEIVGTGFNNFAMPFIRYRTGDLASPRIGRCVCGRNYPLMNKVEGRLQDYIVSHTGRLIPLIGARGAIIKSSQNVKLFQFYQEKEGKVVLRIVKDKAYTNIDTQNIERGFKGKFGNNNLNLTICFVDHIPRTKNGKFRFLIQRLPIGFS